MVEIPVNGSVLNWARKDRCLSLDEASELLKVPSERLTKLEKGDVKPNLTLLKKMASKYDVPLASLLMSKPRPREHLLAVIDHRTFKGAPPRFSHKLRIAIDSAFETIEALYDLKNAAPDLFFDSTLIPQISTYEDIESVANAERHRIGFTVQEQIDLKTPRDAFWVFRNIVEAQGVFVTVANLGDSDNCRGFAINDDNQIPYIFLNSNESAFDQDYPARTFGLLHEYCHIMMRQTVLSDHGRSSKIEAACNSFAAFFLMPRKEFNLKCREIGFLGRPSESDVKTLARTFHSSLTSVAYHLENTENAPSGFGKKVHQKLTKQNIRKRFGRVQHHQKLVNRNGGNLIRVMLGAFDRGLLDEIDVHDITDIKPKYYDRVRSEVDLRAKVYSAR